MQRIKDEERMSLLQQSQDCMQNENYQAAVVCGQELLKNDKNDSEALYILAMAYMKLGNNEKALAFVNDIKKIEPNHIGACMAEIYVYKNEGGILSEVALLSKIILRIEELQKKEKNNCYSKSLSEAWSLLGSAYTMMGQPENAVEAFLKSSKLEKNRKQSIREYSNAIFVMNYAKDFPKNKIEALYAGYQDFFKKTPQYIHYGEEKRKLRVGYISPDFREHPVAFLIYSLLQKFSRDKFEVYCYAANNADFVTQKLQGLVTAWRDVANLEAEVVARVIYDDKIDILVDLSGHTKNNCLPVLAYKPAPIQVSGLGYFNTTALPMVDYFFSDPFCMPEKSWTKFFTEKFLLLPHSLFCYTPHFKMPSPGNAPCLKNGYITFGCFNNFNKVTDHMLIIWREILQRVPGARLLLKSKLFGNPEGQSVARERLSRFGFNMELIELREFTAEYLHEYHDVDIALDTFPYTGGITTCEALYMGVPVITLCGDKYGSRFGYSLLKNAGLEEFIAVDEHSYIEKTILIAHDMDLLNALHKNLRQILNESDLMNSDQYVGEVETAYEMIWENYLCSSQNEKLTDAEQKMLKEKLLKCISKKDYHQAEAIAQKILQNNNHDKDTMGFLTGIYVETGKLEAAQTAVRKIVDIYPTYGYGYFLAARVNYMENKWDKAIQESTWALDTCKDLTNEVRSMIYNLLGNSYKNIGEAQLSVDSYLKSVAYSVTPQSKAMDYSNALFNLHYLAHKEQNELYEAHCKYNLFFQGIKPYQHTRQDFPKKIKIGYISPDMRHHVVIFFSYAMFKNYDHNLFEVTCYAKCAEDAVSRQIAGLVDKWSNINDLDDAAAAKLIYEDQIDILFDLSGHTQHNCLPILAYKPAPIQISGIGYFNTTGLAAVDYFLADIYIDPIGKNQEYFTEKILRLPHSHLCYTPSDNMPPCLPAANIKQGYITFGSFNNFTKTTDEMLRVWLEILQRVPNSKLVLKSKIFSTDYGIEKTRQRMINLGFDFDNIDLRPETDKYLEEYGDIDIALDTYPYPGGGTSCEALYMGVPVVTLVGERHGSRFGYSLMKNIGLSEWCAFSKEEYIKIAVQMAQNKDHLNEIHLALREKMQSSPVMNGSLYMQDIETAYLRIWQDFLQGGKEHSKEELSIKFLTKTKQALNEKDWWSAIYYLQTARSLGVILPEAAVMLSSAYFKLGDYKKAILIVEQALDEKTGDFVELMLLLGQSCMRICEYVRARKAFYQAEEEFDRSRFVGNLFAASELKKSIAYIEQLLGNTEISMKYYEQASELGSDVKTRCQAYSSQLLVAHYRECEEDVLYQKHCRYNQILGLVEQYKHKQQRKHKKIRIGYISPDFRQHIMFYFYHHLLSSYDREQFFVVCYSLSAEDNFSEYLKQRVDKWQNVLGQSYKEIAALIYHDEIDILIDLAGHSANSGLPVLAYKPAPVQISGLGYVDTTGLNTVDYFITDRYVDPAAETAYFSEKLLRLPDSQFCYTGRSDVPIGGKAPCRSNGFITFASFNQYAKITDDMLYLWLEILNRTADSRLILKNQVFNDAAMIEVAKERLIKIGYGISRISFLPATEDYMAEYLNVDIGLDTYPYPGGGTTCEALYMGVPVVSKYGKRHGTRFGYSILSNIGLAELAVEEDSSYIEKSVALAQDWDLLDALHGKLRSIMLESVLMNEKLYLQNIEKIYKEVWQQHQKMPGYNKRS